MIILVLIAGIALRLINLNQSLWLDEAINAQFVRALSLKELIFNYSIGDFHPPFYHILLKGWTMLFGFSEISLRTPSVILGVLSIYLVYQIGKKLFDEKTSLIAATLVATAPLHIYYSQEARMYMLAAFLAAASVYFFISILKEDRIYNWLGFIITTVLLLYSDYLPYLMLVVYLLYLFSFKHRIKKSTLRSFLPAFLLVAILISPWFLVFPKQLSTGLSAAEASPAWVQVVGSPKPVNFALTFVKFTIGRVSVDNNFTYAVFFLPIAIFVIVLFLVSAFRISRLRFILYYWFFIPIIISFLIAFIIPVYAYFRLIFVLGAFYLIWASAINTINWVPPTRILLALALLVNLGSSTIYFLNPKFQRENWKQATGYVISHSNKNSVVLFESTYTVAPFDYYNNGKVEARGALDNFNPTSSGVAEKVNKYTQGKSKVYMFQYLSQITDRQGLLFEELSKAGFINTRTKDVAGVGFIYVFEK